MKDAGPRWWALALAALFLLLGLLYPRALIWPNRQWFRFGLLLSKVTTPIVMGLLFFLAIAPTGILMRMMGKNPLRLAPSKDKDSYWIPREDGGPAAGSMENQF